MSEASSRRTHIPVEGGPDRNVYCNGERLSAADGGMDHLQLERHLDEHTAQFTIGWDDRLTASVELFEHGAGDPFSIESLERVDEAERPTFRGECGEHEFLVELVEVSDE